MRTTAQGITNILRETIAHSRSSQIDVMAGSLAFTTVLSIAPLPAVVFVAFHTLGLFEYGFSKLQPFLMDNLTAGAGAAVQKHLLTFLKKTRAASVGTAGIAGLLFTALLFYNQITRALDQILEVENQKKMTRRVTKSLLVIFLGPLLVTGSLAITTLIASKIKFLPFSGSLMALSIDALVFGLVYRFIPNTRLPLRIIVETALMMAILWEGAKWGYTLYAKRAVSYSKFYGSFSAVPLFFIWVYVSWYLFLMGAALARALKLRKDKRWSFQNF